MAVVHVKSLGLYVQ